MRRPKQDKLFAYVFLDPKNLPKAIMLQYHSGLMAAPRRLGRRRRDSLRRQRHNQKGADGRPAGNRQMGALWKSMPRNSG